MSKKTRWTTKAHVLHTLELFSRDEEEIARWQNIIRNYGPSAEYLINFSNRLRAHGEHEAANMLEE